MSEYAYCVSPCNGPVMGRTRGYLAISHIAFWVWMRLPLRLAFGPLGMAILPRAGDIAFACSCRVKNDAVIAERSKP